MLKCRCVRTQKFQLRFANKSHVSSLVKSSNQSLKIYRFLGCGCQVTKVLFKESRILYYFGTIYKLSYRGFLKQPLVYMDTPMTPIKNNVHCNKNGPTRDQFHKSPNLPSFLPYISIYSQLRIYLKVDTFIHWSLYASCCTLHIALCTLCCIQLRCVAFPLRCSVEFIHYLLLLLLLLLLKCGSGEFLLQLLVNLFSMPYIQGETLANC